MSLERPVAATVDDPELLKRWLYNLWIEVSAPSSGINETNHAALGNLNSLSYTHLTANQSTGLTTGNNTQLHYHAADRDRANHAGVQPSTTISDFATAVPAAARLQAYTVATLPAAVAGDVALVTDALAPAFGAAVVGAGAAIVPVYYTGAAWFVG